jgi:hypothetical protein
VAIDLAPPDGTKIGVVTSSDGAGLAVLSAAEGAGIAEYRIDQLGLEDRVELVVADDRGVEERGAEVIDELADEGVAGVVYLSSGPALEGAAARAEELGLPMLVPYASDEDLVEGREAVWLTGASETAQIEAIKAYAAANDLTFDVFVAEGAPDLEAALGAAAGEVTELGDLGEAPEGYDAVVAAAAAAETITPTGYLIWADAETSARTLAALQRSGSELPVVMSTDATLPLFSDTIQALAGAKVPQAASEGTFVAVAPDATDLDTTAGMSTFLESLSVALRDENYDSLGDPTEAGDVRIGASGVGAHDAVVLLAAAAAQAGSTDPAAVLKVLQEAREWTVAGLAGPAPAFDDHVGLADEQVVALQADASLGTPRTALPAEAGAPLISWFRSETTE